MPNRPRRSTTWLDLARYYFGERSAEAVWTDLARALSLKESIQDALGAVRLEEACASLPTAIIRPRYEFDRLLAESKLRRRRRHRSRRRRVAGADS
jgi:hypothetical protein